MSSRTKRKKQKTEIDLSTSPKKQNLATCEDDSTETDEASEATEAAKDQSFMYMYTDETPDDRWVGVLRKNKKQVKLQTKPQAKVQVKPKSKLQTKPQDKLQVIVPGTIIRARYGTTNSETRGKNIVGS